MDFYLTAPDVKRVDNMTIEERLSRLEKEVAELKEQVSAQPEKVAEVLASNLELASTKMTC